MTIGIDSQLLRKLITSLLFSSVTSTVMAMNIDQLWDFADPAISEQRFRDALDDASADDRLILQTQIARSHGMRRQFDKARDVLASLPDHLDAAKPEVRVRYLLELGRTYASAKHSADSLTPESRELARRLYRKAFDAADRSGLDVLAIDALHMMVFVDPEPDQQLEWNRQAVAYMERSEQPEAKRWEGSLRNNIGYALHLKGEYDAALAQFSLSRDAYQRAERVDNVRIADWMMASTYRAQKKLDEALAIQLRLEKEWDADGRPDPYVFEELEQIYRSRGDEVRAAHYRDRLKAASN